MFDPTIFDNLKVVIEGELYDLDLSGDIAIIDRNDIVNLATMSRCYALTFTTLDGIFKATLRLEAKATDLYGEILEQKKQNGCSLLLIFRGPISNITDLPLNIEQQLSALWKNRPTVQQEIAYEWKQDLPTTYNLKITLLFNKKINEDHISDFPQIIELMLRSLEIVEKISS